MLEYYLKVDNIWVKYFIGNSIKRVNTYITLSALSESQSKDYK